MDLGTIFRDISTKQKPYNPDQFHYKRLTKFEDISDRRGMFVSGVR